MSLKEYISDVWNGFISLLKGMRTTGYYFVHPKEVITEQYPDNRTTLKLADRFKGEVIMPHDENNEHACTGCTACELACPNGTIKVITKFDITPEGKRKKPLMLWSIALSSAPCVISVSQLVPVMPSSCRLPLNTVYSIAPNSPRS